MFKDFCHQIGTKVAFASVYHPQSNGVIERANGLIFKAIKKILEGEKMGKWADVMPKAIWSHNTIVSRATNFTPFRLLFGVEMVLLEEIKHKSFQTMTEASPCPIKAEEKDILESDRLKVVANLQKYPAEMKAWRDPKVKPRAFDVGDLVLLRNPRIESSKKLESKWTRPYAVVEKVRSGHITSRTPRAKCWRIREMRTIFVVFTFKQVIQSGGIVSYK
jgi:hypothetical protein